jgi:hypothetical protein
MDRMLSSDLDASLSTRNQGQLVSTQRVVTETMRTPGLIPVPTPGTVRPVTPGTLGAVDVSLPWFGQVSWKSVLLGVGVGVALIYLNSRRKAALRSKAASMAASMQG